MEPRNEIYNYNFSYGKSPEDAFPDGWRQIGGGAATEWVWEKNPDGSGKIKVINPLAVPAGVKQEKNVYVPAGEQQRWLLKVAMQTDAPDRKTYVRVCFTNPAGFPLGSLILNFQIQPDITEYEDVITTPNGTTAVLVEVGLKDAGSLTIHEICIQRLYPLNRLRLDTKGRVFVNHVAAVQKIIEPIRIRGPIDVKVDARVEADIRSLDYRRDSVKVFGSYGLPLKTNNLGQLQVETSGGGYTGDVETVVSGNAWQYIASRDVSREKVYSFAVLNMGINTALVRTAISPDEINRLWDGAEISLAAGEMNVLVAAYFLRYISVGYRSAIAGSPTQLRFWYQAQS